MASGHASDETSADGFNRSSSNPTHSNSNVQPLGGMGVDAGVNVDVRGGDQHVCVIGLSGLKASPPKGGLIIGPGGPMA